LRDQISIETVCRVVEDDRGFVNGKTGIPFNTNDECIDRGVHVAYNEAATVAATKAVKEFLASTLGVNSPVR
jgi:hypothetical protein